MADEPTRPGPLAERCAALSAALIRSRARCAVVLLVALIISAVSIAYGASIAVDTDLRSLLPETAPSVAAPAL